MKFTVVTISYNQQRFLKQAIESILEQRRDGIEVEYVVVDPGSTDGSREMIDGYGPEIDSIIFDKDDGPADGLTRGFAKATGDVLCYINSDDYLLPGALKSIETFMGNDPDIDVVLADGFKEFDQTGARRRVVAGRFTARRYALGAGIFLQQSTFFSRTAYDLVGGFNVKNSTCWDGELLAMMHLRGASFANLHTNLSVFRIHSTSISGTGRLKEQYLTDQLRLSREILGRSSGRLETSVARISSKCERAALRMATSGAR